MIIYRYDLKADVTQEITVPGADIEVLGVKDSLVGSGDIGRIWVRINDFHGSMQTKLKIHIVATGDELACDKSKMKFIGIIEQGRFVFHLFVELFDDPWGMTLGKIEFKPGRGE